MPNFIPTQSLKGLKDAKPSQPDPLQGPSSPADSGQDDHEMFQPAENGPFQCGHCQYFTAPGMCKEEHMMGKYGDEGGFTTANGQVSDGACCDYYESIGNGGPNPVSGPAGMDQGSIGPQ